MSGAIGDLTMNRRLLSGIGASVCAAAIFAGCGGGGGSGSAPPTARATTIAVPSSAAKPSSASFTFLLPFQRTQSTKRQAKFVSPSTQSVTVSLAGVNGAAPASAITITQNIGATQPGCVQSNTQVACTISIDAPAGNDTFTVTAFDALNGSGNVLGRTTVPAAIVYANAANRITLTLSGVIAQIALFAISPPCGECSNYIYAPGSPSGTVNKELLIPIALDSAGNQIVLLGTYNTPITVTMTPYYSSPPNGVLLTVNNGTPSTSVQVNSPADQVFAVAMAVQGTGYYVVSASFGLSTPTPAATPPPGTQTPVPTPTPLNGTSSLVYINFFGLATPIPAPTATPSPTPTPNPITFNVYAATTPSPSPTPFVLPSGATPTPIPTAAPTSTATPTPGPLPNGGALSMFVGSSTQYLSVNDALNPTGLSYVTSGTNCTPGPSSPIGSITPSSGIPFVSGTVLQIQPTTNSANYGTCTLTVTDSSSATNSITLNIISITGTVQ